MQGDLPQPGPPEQSPELIGIPRDPLGNRPRHRTRHPHRHLQEHAPRHHRPGLPLQITGGHLTPNDEVTAFHWADQADIRQYTSEAYAIRLLDALREGAAPAIRKHDGTELLG